MVTETGNVPQPATPSTNNEHGIKRASDNRRSNKPIMEKRRRARINNCLNQLKTLILDAMKKDPARHSKLEKADILEMTVKHLQNVQRCTQGATDPTVANKFRAGFSECASEVGRYPGLEAPVKRRLLQHLANCLNQQQTAAAKSGEQMLQNGEFPQASAGNSIIMSQNGVQFVQTRLPNGDIALVIPNNPNLLAAQNGSGSVPLLVPIPTRTSSTASASSSSSHYSSSESPEPMEVQIRYSPPMPKPLSLVMRKSVAQVKEEEDDEKPWRPW